MLHEDKFTPISKSTSSKLFLLMRLIWGDHPYDSLTHDLLSVEVSPFDVAGTDDDWLNDEVEFPAQDSNLLGISSAVIVIILFELHCAMGHIARVLELESCARFA